MKIQNPFNELTNPLFINNSENENCESFLDKVNELILENLEDSNFSVHQLSEALSLSRMQVHRKIKSATNLTTTHYIRSQRLAKAKILLENKNYSISEIAYKMGFANLSYFSRCFQESFGESPSEYRNKYK